MYKPYLQLQTVFEHCFTSFVTLIWTQTINVSTLLCYISWISLKRLNWFPWDVRMSLFLSSILFFTDHNFHVSVFRSIPSRTLEWLILVVQLVYDPEGLQELSEVDAAVLVEVDTASQLIDGPVVDVNAQVIAEQTPGVTELLGGDQTWTRHTLRLNVEPSRRCLRRDTEVIYLNGLCL